MTRRQRVQLGLSATLTLILVGFLWQFIDAEQLRATLRQTHFGWWSFACALLVLVQYWRARRLNALLGGHSALFGLMCAQGVLNRLLPAWAGEAVLVWLLKRWHRVNMTRGTVSVLAARVLDVVMIILFALIAVAIWPDRVPVAYSSVVGVICVGFVLAAVLLVITWRWLVRKASTLRHNNAMVLRAGVILVKLDEEWRALVQRGELSALLLWTSLIWITVLIYFASIAFALRANLSIADIVWVHVIVAPVRLLPIKGIANFGTHEASWMFALSALGLSTTTATVLAFSSHILMLCSAVVLALAATFALSLAPNAPHGD